jgi:predicted ABC-type ATPase
VKLIFLSLPNTGMALARVASRVAQSGHHVPDHVVRRRFEAGLRNLNTLYKPIVDYWLVYEDSGAIPLLCGEGGIRWVK